MESPGPAVVREIRLDAPAEDVWDALTRSDLLGAWLAADAEIEPEPGGRVEVREAGGEVREGVVERADPCERLTIHWWTEAPGSTSTVDFRIVALPGGGSRLRVAERRLAGPVASAVPAAVCRIAPLLAAVHAVRG